MDSSHSSVGSGAIDQSQSTKGLLSIFQKNSSDTISPIRNDGLATSLAQQHRKQTKADSKRIMATAKAIADDESHPNQEEVCVESVMS